jgi:Ca-activated chloride channel family protein
VFLAIGCAFCGGAARGQGLIVDRRPDLPIGRAFEVREVTIDGRVRDQVAEVQVSQTFHNPNSFQLESEFLFPLPEEGAIQNFVLMVDGRELPGKLLDKDEARRIYEQIVRSKKDPALLEYMGRGLIRTSVFPIPANEDRKVTLRYTKLLPREGHVVEFAYPFATQKFTTKPIQRLAMDVRIESKEPIKSIYSPTDDVEIRRSGDHEATVKLVRHDVIPSADFRLVYTTEKGRVGASVLSYRPSEGEDGYFLLLASPEVEKPDAKPEPKSVIFVLDRSGSMSGKKIEQAKGALQFVLENLREHDTFNIVVYDDRVETFKPELQRYSEDARREALRYVQNIFPGGSTNINAALETALGLIRDDDRPHYVLFLTDGLPTAGETGEAAIAENAHKANDEHARVFSFGVGYDVNARLLDRVSGGNGGTSVYVKPDEDIEAHVSRFYEKLTSPVLTGIAVEMPGTDTNRVYPRDVPDLFQGGQLVLVGRYRDSGPTKVVLSGKVGDERQTFRFEAELAAPGSHRHEYVETLWAMRRVGDLIDQIDLHGASTELTQELVELSKRYGILTPYTSFLADENVPLYSATILNSRAGVELEQLREVQGSSGVNQRLYKGGLQQAGRVDANAAYDFARAPATAPAGPASRGYSEGGGRMMAGAVGAANKPAANAAPVIAKDAEGRETVVGSVRRVGEKTFYKRGERWVDASITEDEEKGATSVVQFSDAYFDLARGQSAEMNQYLTFEEPVTVKLGDRVYNIERPKSE